MKRLALFLCAVSCTNTRLEYPEKDVEIPAVDDELTVKGDFCTSPAANVAYPVKVMFLVDGSGSQQFSDQNRQRVVAVEDTINALIGSPNVYFKVIVYNASVSAVPTNFGSPPPAVFTSDLNALVPALANLAEADTLTDYQGVLSVAYSELLRDMVDVFTSPTRGPAELARTKYVVILISDGFPDPQCQAGIGNDTAPTAVFPDGIDHLCEDQNYLNCLLKVQDDPLTGLSTTCTGGVCTFGTARCYDIPESNTLFGGLNNTELAGGADYNQPYQILQKVQDIMDLEQRFDVGEIRVHSGLVFDPDADPAVIQLFGDPNQAKPLMQQVAETGEGTYMEFYGGDQIDFLQLNYDSLKQPRVVRSFFASDRAASVGSFGSRPDTDFDGLSDDDEFELATDARRADTDRDGYSDLFEEKRRGFGFDPKDACKPALIDVAVSDPLAPCNPAQPVNCAFGFGTDPLTGTTIRVYDDTDHDGLHDCEEKQLGTDRTAADTDHDGVPDLLELIYGTDPTGWDYERDDDQDGVPNGREVEWHLHPLVQQTDAQTRDRYRYDRPQISSTLDGRPCYSFEVRRIKLAPTLDNIDLVGNTHEVGWNETRLYIIENMADDLAGPPLVRTACVRARYVPPTLKEPPGGVVELTEADFHYLPSQDPIFNDPRAASDIFDPATDCIVPE